VGFCGIFEHFSGFEFFLLPSRIHARPHAGNANRWAASPKTALSFFFEFVHVSSFFLIRLLRSNFPLSSFIGFLFLFQFCGLQV
jgi:hypothetical protein